jgi:nucleoside-diphosphate-sugar epimerase
MTNIVITGATSFIGQYLAKAYFADVGEFYLVVRRKSLKARMFPKGAHIHIISLDFDEYDKLPEYVSTPIDIFYHFTWDGTKGIARLDRKLQESNYRYSMRTLAAASNMGTTLFFSAGSQAEYGPCAGKITEDMVPHPVTEYGREKLHFYEDAVTFCQQHAMRFIEPRFFSVYGLGNTSSTLITATLYKMIYNKRCEFTDSSQLWNFLYVEDAVKAIKWLAEHDCADGAYNLGTEITKPLKEFIQDMAIMTRTKSELRFGVIPHNDTGIYGINPDISKILATGWQPQISFSEGIKVLLATYR